MQPLQLLFMLLPSSGCSNSMTVLPCCLHRMTLPHQPFQPEQSLLVHVQHSVMLMSLDCNLPRLIVPVASTAVAAPPTTQ